MLDLILEPLQYGFMVRAFAVSMIVGAICAVVGSYVVMRGLAFMGDAVSHAVLPGLVGAFLIGLNPLWGAIAVAIAVAVIIGLVSRRTGLSEDTSIGIFFAGLFALGVVMLSTTRGLPFNLEDILLGQVLAVTEFETGLTAAMAVLVALILFLFHKELTFASFDDVGARVVGLPTGALSYLLMALLALVVVIALQAVGIILVMAMLVTPAATAYLLVQRFVPMMFVGAALGMVAAVVGLYGSYYVNVPSGAAMVLVATTGFGLTVLLRRRVA